MSSEGLCFLQSPRSEHKGQNVTSSESSLVCLQKQNKAIYSEYRPKFLFFLQQLSLARVVRSSPRSTDTHTASHTPGRRSDLLWLLLQAVLGSQPSLQTRALGPRLPGLGALGAPVGAASAETSASPAPTPPTPRFRTGFTNCTQDYKQWPRFHRNAIIPVTLKAILPLQPLCIGSSQNTYWPLYIQSGLPDAQVQTPAIIYHLNSSGTNKVSCNRPDVDISAELFGVMSCLLDVIRGYFIFIYTEQYMANLHLGALPK